jgi:DNA-binding transcriptional regulator GbsR (MarR family)
MSNIRKREIRKTRHRFIQGMAELLTHLGIPQAAARLYGYLLLCEGSVSLDRIVAEAPICKPKKPATVDAGA